EGSGQVRGPGAGAAGVGMGGGRVGVWPQFQPQRVQVMGLLQAGRAGDPEGLGGLTPPDEQSPVAGLYLRGLMVFERVFGAVATQPGQTFGTPPTAGGVLTHGAGRADEGPAPRQRGPGPVQRITGGTGGRDRGTRQILLSSTEVCWGWGEVRARDKRWGAFLGPSHVIDMSELVAQLRAVVFQGFSARS